MANLKTVLCASALWLLHSTPAASQIRINEIMQSNIDCVMDELNEFPDSWVEVYNNTDATVNLNDYSIGDTDDPTTAWKLPSKNVSPHSFALIYCDKVGDGLHANFRLESGKGGSVYLYKNGVLVDKLENLKKQPAPNVAYGRLQEDSDKWGYQLAPTPGASNCGTFSKGMLDKPIFGFHGEVGESAASRQLTLALPDDAPAETIIRYTTDGSEPTGSSTAYTAPITISATKVVRAKLFCDGYLSPRSTTHSYITLDREMTLPVISITTDDKYLNDNKIGIYVEGTYNREKKNYQYDWRRPINIELFDAPNAASKINQLCETRVAGAASRGWQFKSLAIYANKRFGTKRFKYEFFPDQRPGQTNYKSLVLRNAGNDADYLFMRDAIAQRSVATYADLDYQAWQPAIIYINGKYSGMLNIRERANEDNIFTNYDELEDVDVVENWYELKEGSMDNLDAFKQFYNEHGHTLDEYAEWMDIDEFINLFVMNSYFNNIDFPANNFMMWRPRTENGRWRFIAKDLDYIMGLYGQQAYNYEYFSWLNYNDYDQSVKWGNTYEATRLFRRLMEDADFKLRFTDRMAIYMGDFLNYDRIWDDLWQPMYEKIKTEYPVHRKLINQWWPNYSEELTAAQRWVKRRTDFMYQHVSNYYKTEPLTRLTINADATDEELEGMHVLFNGVELSKGRFNGKYYQGRTITLDATADADLSESIAGWKIIEVDANGATKAQTVHGAAHSFTMPACSQLIITPVFGSIDGIKTPYAEAGEQDAGKIAAIYNAQGVALKTMQPGLNILHFKNGRVMKICQK